MPKLIEKQQIVKRETESAIAGKLDDLKWKKSNSERNREPKVSIAAAAVAR